MSRSDEIKLNLQAGQIPVTFDFTTSTPELWMKQLAPAFGAQVSKTKVAHALGVSESDISDDTPIEEVSTGFPTLIVPLQSEEALNGVDIDKEAYFSLIGDAWAKIILVFSLQGSHEILVRVFADYYGVPEDAATGSSNGSLAAYLAQHQVLGSANIKTKVCQGRAMGRPSTLHLQTTVSGEDFDVLVGGSVVAVAEGVWG